jgi:hypothetical protein
MFIGGLLSKTQKHSPTFANLVHKRRKRGFNGFCFKSLTTNKYEYTRVSPIGLRRKINKNHSTIERHRENLQSSPDFLAFTDDSFVPENKRALNLLPAQDATDNAYKVTSAHAHPKTLTTTIIAGSTIYHICFMLIQVRPEGNDSHSGRLNLPKEHKTSRE